MQTTIEVRTSFEGLHCWPHAPDEVSFLRNPHRHVFNVEAEFLVTHEDRDLEFFMVKRQIDGFYAGQYGRQTTMLRLGSTSCETLAKELLFHFHELGKECLRVTVREDDENAATVRI